MKEETEDTEWGQVIYGMPETPVEVWMPETETWMVTESPPISMTYVHSKTVAGILYDLFKDRNDRWLRVIAD